MDENRVTELVDMEEHQSMLNDMVAELIKEGKYKADRTLTHTHLGSIGNPGNEQIRKAFEKEYAFFEEE